MPVVPLAATFAALAGLTRRAILTRLADSEVLIRVRREWTPAPAPRGAPARRPPQSARPGGHPRERPRPAARPAALNGAVTAGSIARRRRVLIRAAGQEMPG
jgi:hypothetical protein